ncbi:MAG: ATP synthase F1 subunit epsilon, partial [Candidatus Parcubacteria bacterium]|nr:ATP synthase F1 subunit epsilon [Candidatus Parcubacteria bacterium]
ITTPERKVFLEEAQQISIPTQMGEITVLPEHIPLVAVLVPGELRILKDKEEILMAVSGGFIEVLPNKVTILVDSAEHAEEIDEKRAEEARQRALGLQKEKRFDDQEFASLSAKIEKELARLKVVRKKKYRNLPPKGPFQDNK